MDNIPEQVREDDRDHTNEALYLAENDPSQSMTSQILARAFRGLEVEVSRLSKRVEELEAEVKSNSSLGMKAAVSADEAQIKVEELKAALKEKEAEVIKLTARVRIQDEPCGRNIILPAGRVGCGGEFTWEGELYRCLDCGTPFHKHCLRKHCDDDLSALRELVAKKDEALKMAKTRIGGLPLNQPDQNILDAIDEALDRAEGKS